MANFLIVDDVEDLYTDDEGNRIYEIWVDGWTNNTGAVVGNLTTPFAERTIVHGGRQSMPFDYNNIKRRTTAKPSGPGRPLRTGRSTAWTP